MDFQVMRERLAGLMKGAMAGRTMYVIPFSMGPIGAAYETRGVVIPHILRRLTNGTNWSRNH